MRFPAVSVLLALNCALSVWSAPVIIGKPSGLSLAKRSSGVDTINIQIEIKIQQNRASQMDDQKQLNEQLMQIAAEKDKKKRRKEQQQYEELKEMIDKKQHQLQMELQNLLDEQKKLLAEEKEEQERIEAQLKKAKEMRAMDRNNNNKNFVVIFVQIVIVIDHNGRWAPPRYETATQVSYNQSDATTVQTQWITDSAVQYVTEGSPEETMVENSMAVVVAETSAETAMAMGTAVDGSISGAMSSIVEGIPPMTVASAEAASLMTETPVASAEATSLMAETPVASAEAASLMAETPVASAEAASLMTETPEAPTAASAMMEVSTTPAAPMMHHTPMA